jgi:hypothetical protein
MYVCVRARTVDADVGLVHSVPACMSTCILHKLMLPDIAVLHDTTAQLHDHPRLVNGYDYVNIFEASRVYLHVAYSN